MRFKLISGLALSSAPASIVAVCGDDSDAKLRNAILLFHAEGRDVARGCSPPSLLRHHDDITVLMKTR